MRIVFSIIALIAISFHVDGQAWTKSKGHGFYKLDFTSITGNKLFNDKAVIVDYQDYSFNTVSAYGEYGITDKLTVVGYIPFLQSNSLKAGALGPKASNAGFGDVDVAFRYAVSKEKFPLALTLQLGIPSGNHTNKDELYTGDGEFNQLVKIASGAGADKWWLQGGFGFNNRSKNFADEF
jgi:protein XagA